MMQGQARTVSDAEFEPNEKAMLMIDHQALKKRQRRAFD